MRTCIAIVATVCALAIAPNAVFAEEREYPLFEAPDYSDGGYSYVMFQVLNAIGYPMNMSVSVSFVDVQLRTDGKTHTSLRCSGVEEYSKQCSRATILVPVKEDVDAWKAEVLRWQELRKKFLDGLPKPRRVLPRIH